MEEGWLLRRRKLGFFLQKEEEEECWVLTLSLWFSQFWPKVKEEEWDGFNGRLSASGGFESTDAGRLQLKGELVGEATRDSPELMLLWEIRCQGRES